MYKITYFNDQGSWLLAIYTEEVCTPMSCVNLSLNVKPLLDVLCDCPGFCHFEILCCDFSAIKSCYSGKFIVKKLTYSDPLYSFW